MPEPTGDYEGLSRDALVARLKVAEDALTLIGWSSIPMHEGTERSDAAQQAWMTWSYMVPGGCPGPQERPDLVRMEPVMADARQRIRAETLRRLTDDNGSSAGERT